MPAKSVEAGGRFGRLWTPAEIAAHTRIHGDRGVSAAANTVAQQAGSGLGGFHVEPKT